MAMEAPGWPPQYYQDSEVQVQASAQAQGHGQAPHGIVVRNTFIDVCQPEESDSDGSPCMSPHRRNLSAPPSPARRGRGGHNDPWGKESDEEEEEDPGSIPNYQWAGQANLLTEAAPHDSQLYQSSSWPDQYIEDDPAYKLWNERSEAGGIAPPGLLLPPGSPSREGKSGRKGRRVNSREHHGSGGLKGQPHRPPLGSFLRTAEPGLGGLPDVDLLQVQGSEGAFMQQGVELGGYGHGASSGLEQTGLWQPGLSGLDQDSAQGLAGHDRGSGSAGSGFLQDPDLSGRGIGSGFTGRMPGGGGLQELWSSHATGRWSDTQEPADSQAAVGSPARAKLEAAAGLAPPPPPIEPPPSREQAAQEDEHGGGVFMEGMDPSGAWGGQRQQKAPVFLLGTTHNGNQSSPILGLPGQQGVGSRKQQRGIGMQRPGENLRQGGGADLYQSDEGMPTFRIACGTSSGTSAGNGGGQRPAIGPPPGHFTEGSRRPSGGPPGNFDGASLQVQGGFSGPLSGPFSSPYADYGMPNPAGRGIAGGAGAVGPVVPERGPFPPGSPMGPAAGRGGKDPLAVGSAAPRPTAVGSLYEAAPYSSSSMKAEDSAMGALGYAPSPGGSAYPAGRGAQGNFPMSSGHSFQPLGAHGPWVPEGVDISAAFAMPGRGGRGDGGGGRGRGGQEAKAGNRMPLSGGGPKRTDYIKKYGTGTDERGHQVQPITTMMLKNIPCRKSQEEVMAQIDKRGFATRYDFFYLPRDVKFRANLGYAFINFVTPEDADQFQKEMNGYRFVNSGSSKACVVVPAHVQGLMNNLAAFKRTEVMRSSRKPFFSGVVAL